MLQRAPADGHLTVRLALASHEGLGDVRLLGGEGELHTARGIDRDLVLGPGCPLIQDVLRQGAEDREIRRRVVFRRGRVTGRRTQLALVERVEDEALLMRLAVGHHRGHLDGARVSRLGRHGEGRGSGVGDERGSVVLVDGVPGQRLDRHSLLGAHTQRGLRTWLLRARRTIDGDVVVIGVDVVLEGNGDERRLGQLRNATVAPIDIAQDLARSQGERQGARDGAIVTRDAQADDRGDLALEGAGVLDDLVDLALGIQDGLRVEERGLGS